eukprot:5475540-Pyramimonas_sp.AAC.2
MLKGPGSRHYRRRREPQGRVPPLGGCDDLVSSDRQVAQEDAPVWEGPVAQEVAPLVVHHGR